MKYPLSKRMYDKVRKVMPFACVDIVATFGGKYLLLKRAIPPLDGYWCVPGGRIHFGWTLELAAHEKLVEETGLIPIQLKQIGAYTYFHEERHDISITFLAWVEHAEVRRDYQHSQALWVALPGLPEPIHEVTKRQIIAADLELGLL